MKDLIIIYSFFMLMLITVSILIGMFITENKLFKIFGFVVIFIVSIILVMLGVKV